MPPENTNQIDTIIEQNSQIKVGSSKKKWLIMIGIVLLLIIIVFTAKLFLSGKNNTGKQVSVQCVVDTQNMDKPAYFPISYSTREKITSPLFIAVINGDTVQAINLINNGADVNEKIEMGKGGYLTPLMIAASTGANQITKCLLAQGADPMVVTDQGRNALMFAAVQGREGTVDLLAKDGRSVKTEDIRGKTPLILGVISGNYNVVDSLLKAGSNVDVQDKLGPGDIGGAGMTALMWACEGPLDICNLLLDYGADSTLKNDNGMMARDYLELNIPSLIAPSLDQANNLIKRLAEHVNYLNVIMSDGISITDKGSLMRAGGVISEESKIATFVAGDKYNIYLNDVKGFTELFDEVVSKKYLDLNGKNTVYDINNKVVFSDMNLDKIYADSNSGHYQLHPFIVLDKSFPPGNYRWEFIATDKSNIKNSIKTIVNFQVK